MGAQEKCPFTVGQAVLYKPSQRGLDDDATTPPSRRLTPGQRYVIARIDRSDYVVVEGYDRPGVGIYWTEFEAIAN